MELKIKVLNYFTRNRNKRLFAQLFDNDEISEFILTTIAYTQKIR